MSVISLGMAFKCMCHCVVCCSDPLSSDADLIHNTIYHRFLHDIYTNVWVQWLSYEIDYWGIMNLLEMLIELKLNITQKTKEQNNRHSTKQSSSHKDERTEQHSSLKRQKNKTDNTMKIDIISEMSTHGYLISLPIKIRREFISTMIQILLIRSQPILHMPRQHNCRTVYTIL